MVWWLWIVSWAQFVCWFMVIRSNSLLSSLQIKVRRVQNFQQLQEFVDSGPKASAHAVIHVHSSTTVLELRQKVPGRILVDRLLAMDTCVFCYASYLCLSCSDSCSAQALTDIWKPDSEGGVWNRLKNIPQNHCRLSTPPSTVGKCLNHYTHFSLLRFYSLSVTSEINCRLWLCLLKKPPRRGVEGLVFGFAICRMDGSNISLDLPKPTKIRLNCVWNVCACAGTLGSPGSMGYLPRLFHSDFHTHRPFATFSNGLCS